MSTIPWSLKCHVVVSRRDQAEINMRKRKVDSTESGGACKALTSEHHLELGHRSIESGKVYKTGNRSILIYGLLRIVSWMTKHVLIADNLISFTVLSLSTRR